MARPPNATDLRQGSALPPVHELVVYGRMCSPLDCSSTQHRASGLWGERLWMCRMLACTDR